ncbi:MAG TPA: CpsB/CapC family capsule biosynthesis tyrosine phosphatase [Pirellulales bacterium]|jgi:protein-tyrosine phosphatase|nr:CpsB/CapC family capsule biosynthesis tyrosine phosphatase [Pirellulales bacterium]
MNQAAGFVDIHCHLLPGIDDGAKNWDDSLAMARMAVADGIETIVCTPHQLGGFSQNRGGAIRALTEELSQRLAEHEIPLTVLPGADVRIESGMIALVRQGEVLSLADHRRHILLELPHELYFPLDRLLLELSAAGMVGILSHPERNAGIMSNPAIVGSLVDAGCLMQITAGSLLGAFGPQSQSVAERLASDGLVHFVSTDAHGLKSRRPRLAAAHGRMTELVGSVLADQCCRDNPAAVAAGRPVAGGRCAASSTRSGWFGWKKAG